MKVYLVYQVLPYSGWSLLKVFDTSKKAWLYRDHQEDCNEDERSTYIVQEEEVQ